MYKMPNIGYGSAASTRCIAYSWVQLLSLIAEHQAYAPLRLQEGAGAQCEGVGGADDDQQDLLRRDRSWSLCKEQEDFGWARRSAGYQVNIKKTCSR